MGFLAHLSLWAHWGAYSVGILHRPSGVGRPSTIFKDLLLQNRLASQSQISYGASVGLGNESLFAGSESQTKMAAMPIYDKKP